MAYFKSLFTEPVLTTYLNKIERQAAQIFTQEIFKEVKNEIEGSGAFNVVERVENTSQVTYKLNKYCKPDRKICVAYDILKSEFLCDCKLFQSRGIPCCHVICAMKHEHMDHFPNSLICKRWTKTAKSEYISAANSEELESDTMIVARFASLVASCNRLCEIASKSSETFKWVRDEIFKLIKR
ncbi:Zinc finger, PMZ-type [Sesbania bispinosa]|nr:Zinc finger, PMZ-type [Sesbania bispinosa]